MQDNLIKIGAKVCLSNGKMLIERITYVYEDGMESEPLSRFVHLGMFTDSILFGEECQLRFFVYLNSLKLYDTDVDTLEFINNSSRRIEISCFGQQTVLAPEKTVKFKSDNAKKFKHTTKSTQ